MVLNRIVKYLMHFYTKLRYRKPWEELPGGFMRRKYSSEAEYLNHQKSKGQYLDLTERHRYLKVGVNKRVVGLYFMKPGLSVLCLGARSGGEVEAFLDMGCFALGIDIMPTKLNRFVVYGDFHQLQFPDSCVDVVYTNTIDHALDIEKVFSEINRVLKDPGYFILEIPMGIAEGKRPEYWESVWWQRIADVTLLVERAGFCWLTQRPYADKKEQVCFQKSG